MKIIGRAEAAKRLGMTPHALSCHVYKRNWDAIPVPIMIGGRYKWIDEKITEWITARFEAVNNGEELLPPQKKRGPGRPRKKRRSSCC
ncbi:hypothetical protein [Pseudodesulfovibrio tunisiensis]|uniref:hypothetical protein n=1 Tax=Pseudodesulfovibrio tunisiensis TaxID=463192 RepID=UPI001FB51788|nr:hypothetical protein [Pseudodesulfovibrio tunisiensis]